MKFILEIATDNAAFELDPEHEVSRILKETAQKLETGRDPGRGRIRDANGNYVGGFEFSGEALVCGF